MDNNKMFDVMSFFYLLKKRWYVIFLVTVLAAGGMFSYSKFFTVPTYNSYSKIFIGNTEDGEIYTDKDLSKYKTLMETFIELMKTPDFIDDVIKNQGLNISAGEVLGGLSITQSNQFLQVTYTSSDSAKVKPVIDAVVNEFVEYSQRLVPNGNVQVVQKAKIPMVPNNLNYKKNTILGLIIGIITSLGIIFIMDLFDNTIKSSSELENLLKIPVVGQIPKTDIKKELNLRDKKEVKKVRKSSDKK